MEIEEPHEFLALTTLYRFGSQMQKGTPPNILPKANFVPLSTKHRVK